MKIEKEFKPLLRYTVRFLGAFCLLFYGTEAVIALSSPENRYSPFVARYLDFVAPYCRFLLAATKGLVALLGIQTGLQKGYMLTVAGGTGIRLAFDCIGYGVLSFWAAFVLANRGTARKKLAWIMGGSALLSAINIVRLSLVLVANNRGWPAPLGWDHHTWFNIVTYLFIFAMIWRFDRTGYKKSPVPPSGNGKKAPKELGATPWTPAADNPENLFIVTHTTANDRTRN